MGLQAKEHKDCWEPPAPIGAEEASSSGSFTVLTFDPRQLASRTVRELISVIISHLVGSDLFGQP